MPPSSEAVAAKNKKFQDDVNFVCWCLCGTVVVALATGTWKMVAELKAHYGVPPQPKQPWEQL
jgi:hypothetical protein